MFPCRYGRRNSGNPCWSVFDSVWVESWRVFSYVVLVNTLVVWCWVVDARHALLLRLLTRLCWCVGVGQALGLLVPVGWALLLYTSGLSTP